MLSSRYLSSRTDVFVSSFVDSVLDKCQANAISTHLISSSTSQLTLNYSQSAEVEQAVAEISRKVRGKDIQMVVHVVRWLTRIAGTCVIDFLMIQTSSCKNTTLE